MKNSYLHVLDDLNKCIDWDLVISVGFFHVDRLMRELQVCASLVCVVVRASCGLHTCMRELVSLCVHAHARTCVHRHTQKLSDCANVALLWVQSYVCMHVCMYIRRTCTLTSIHKHAYSTQCIEILQSVYEIEKHASLIYIHTYIYTYAHSCILHTVERDPAKRV
jgi:hypothetical protein